MIGRPPLLSAGTAVQETLTTPVLELPEALGEVGAAAGATVVIESALEGLLSPTAFVEITVTEYAVPGDKPVMLQVVPLVVQVPEPPDEVAVTV